jgi:hypothetical protein
MTAQVVEHWNAFARIRRDLFDVIDVVALDGLSIIGVQATSGTNHAKRLGKVLATPAARLWVESGGRLLVVSWSKCGARGKAKRWTPRVTDVSLAMFTSEDAAA